MANFIISYDLNGSTPTHKQVDQRLEELGAARGRILETVWYVGWNGSCESLFDHVNAILSPNDRLIVVEAKDIVWRHILVTDESMHKQWRMNR